MIQVEQCVSLLHFSKSPSLHLFHPSIKEKNYNIFIKLFTIIYNLLCDDELSEFFYFLSMSNEHPFKGNWYEGKGKGKAGMQIVLGFCKFLQRAGFSHKSQHNVLIENLLNFWSIFECVPKVH